MQDTSSIAARIESQWRSSSAAHRPGPAPVALPAVAWSLLLALAGVKLGLHALSSGLVGYGYSADELYFLDCANRLAWGYVDHPPFSIAVLWAARAALGDSLVVLRLVSASAGAIAAILTGLIAREMGGGRGAQALAALALVVSPVTLFTTGYYSMNAFDLALWTLASYLVVLLLNGTDERLWRLLGVVLGVGLLNKWSMLWFGIGLGVGVIATPQRRWLVTPWPWLCGLIASAIWVPNLLWQMQHDWPTLEFMRNGMADVMVAKSPLSFVRDQFPRHAPAPRAPRSRRPRLRLREPPRTAVPSAGVGVDHGFPPAVGKWQRAAVLSRPRIFNCLCARRSRLRARRRAKPSEVVAAGSRRQHHGGGCRVGAARGTTPSARALHCIRARSRHAATADRV